MDAVGDFLPLGVIKYLLWLGGWVRRGGREVELAQQGYPIDSTDPNWWCFLLSVPPTSILYGTDGT